MVVGEWYDYVIAAMYGLEITDTFNQYTQRAKTTFAARGGSQAGRSRDSNESRQSRESRGQAPTKTRNGIGQSKTTEIAEEYIG